jgi:hypothetical protein
MAIDRYLSEKLAKLGWEVECFSPFEAYNADSNSRVSGHDGEALLQSMLEWEEKDKKWEDVTRLQEFYKKGILDREAFALGIERILSTEEE